MRCTDLIEQPVTTKNYQIYDVKELPKLFLGIKVKNKFDESRMAIKPKYKPRYVSHFRLKSELEPFYIYGIEVTPKKQYKGLIKRLNFNTENNLNINFDRFVHWYQNVLLDYGLTCNSCYRYLSDGLYPIDIECLNMLSKSNYTKEIESGFACMMEDTEQPWYMNLHNFNIFILGFSTAYNLDYQINANKL